MQSLGQATIALIDSDREVTEYLRSKGVRCVGSEHFSSVDVCVVGPGEHARVPYRSRIRDISLWVRAGGSLVFIEPEFELTGTQRVSLLEGVALDIERRADEDRGGYDSYVFAEKPDHPLWRGIDKEHLKMFNGGFGGEVISQHDVIPTVNHTVHARCGLGLRVVAACEFPYGGGRVVVSRLQTRGRLMAGPDTRNLFARRPDPVMQTYLHNLLDYCVPGREWS